MEPAKTPKPRQREQEADHEQEHEHLKGQNDPRCLKWGEGRAPSRRKESLPCSQASGRGVRIVHHRVGQYLEGVLRSEMVDKSTSHLQTSFGPVFYPETVQTGLLLPE